LAPPPVNTNPIFGLLIESCEKEIEEDRQKDNRNNVENLKFRGLGFRKKVVLKIDFGIIQKLLSPDNKRNPFSFVA
jgi:hypothetical protein